MDLKNPDSGNYGLQMFQSSLVLFANVLIGMTVGIALLFAFRGGLPLGATNVHVVLCVIGYQLLMAQAILSLSQYNGWTSKFKFIHKARSHLILQIVGSLLAIIGSFIKILDKDVHWNTYHGQFALVAMVFTTVCLVNGCASMYSYELRRFIPANLSRLTHICFGVVAFSASSIALCYGFDKGLFRNWATTAFADTLIAFVSIFTFIIIVNPLIKFGTRTLSLVRN